LPWSRRSRSRSHRDRRLGASAIIPRVVFGAGGAVAKVMGFLDIFGSGGVGEKEQKENVSKL
jgi:hypothetical protein